MNITQLTMSKYLNLIFGDELGNELTGLNIESLGLDIQDMVGEEKLVAEAQSETDHDGKIMSSENNNKQTKIKAKKIEKESLSIKQKEYVGKNTINLNKKYQKLLMKDDCDDELMDLNNSKPNKMTEDDLKLELLAVENNEKIYRLTDLFIPVNNKLTRKLEKYNAMIIDDIEKNEVDPKKEQQEQDELRNLVKKSRKIQKYIKVNFSYNEKFFDKTFFLENYNDKTSNFLNEANSNTQPIDAQVPKQTQNSLNQNAMSNSNNYNFLNNNQHQLNNNSNNELGLKENNYTINNTINNIFDTKQIYYNQYRQSNLNPYFSLIYQLNSEKNNTNESNNSLTKILDKNDINDEETLETPSNIMSYINDKDKEIMKFYEKRMLQSLNEVYSEYLNSNEEIDFLSINSEEKIENKLNYSYNSNNSTDNTLKEANQNENSEYESSNSKISKENSNNVNNNIEESEYNKTVDEESMVKSIQITKGKVDLIKENLKKGKKKAQITKKDPVLDNPEFKEFEFLNKINNITASKEKFGELQEEGLETSNNNFLLSPLCSKELEGYIKKLYNLNSTDINTKEHLNSNSKLALHDFLKKKRYKFAHKINPEISSGRFIHSILLDEEFFPNYDEYLTCLNNFKSYSNRIFDLSDYNMVFEQSEQKALPAVISSTNDNQVATDNYSGALRKKSEDYAQYVPQSNLENEQQFSKFLKRVSLSSYCINPSNNQKLKIVKSKNNAVTHAKCAYSLTYNKINLSMDELKNFHRLDFAKYLLNYKLEKSQFKLPSSELDKAKVKSYPVVVRTRQYLRDRERKRIQKNVQYMNAFEVFKNHHKLSLCEGKFSLFEHIDEDPLFVNNFGMAFKLKKFLYTNKLFNCYNNPNMINKLTESEHKTLNMLGPNGVQIPLQPEQKIPLLGQLDCTDLKGISIIDNKLFKSPVFYEKYNPTVYIDEDLYEKNSKKINNDNYIIADTTMASANSNIEEGNNKIVINNSKPNNNTNSRRDKRLRHVKAKDSNHDDDSSKKEGNNYQNSNNKIIIPKFNDKSINIKPSNNQSINSNSMLNIKQEKKRMQFLLVFKKKPESSKENPIEGSNIDDSAEKFYIRELEHNYLVGQEEPKLEIYPPQSKQYNYFMEKKVHTYVDKIYEEIGFSAGINFKFFANLFPNITEQQLKKHFKKLGIEIDKNICFYTPNKSSGQRNENKITPENICQYESSQYGVLKLRQLGIRNLTNSDKISYATNKFITNIKDLKQQFLAKVIEEEILTTPWNLTQNYLQAKQINGMLSIKGIGDPSNGNGGYSYIKMPVKQYNTENKTLKEEIDLLKEQNKNIKSVTGTDADLRKLPKSILKMKLIQLGVEEEYINKLSRWERVSLLRFKSSKAAELGYEGDITKYARGDRIGTSMQKETYQNNINEVFKIFIDYISDAYKEPYYLIKPNNLLSSNNNVLISEGNKRDTIDNMTIKINDSNKIIINNNNNNNSNNIVNNTSNKFTLDLKEDTTLETGYFEDEQEDITLYDKNANFKSDKMMSSNMSNSKILGKKRKFSRNNSNKNEKFIKLYSKDDEGATKIQFEMGNDDIEYLKQKRRRNQGFDKFYEFDETTRNSTIRRRCQLERKLNEILEDIVDACIRFDKSKLFHFAVKKKDYPDYYDKIKKPIDLTMIKNKTKRNEYTNANDFEKDIKQMFENSQIYNGNEESSSVTRQARLILDFAQDKITSKSSEIEEEVRKRNVNVTGTPSTMINKENSHISSNFN